MKRRLIILGLVLLLLLVPTVNGHWDNEVKWTSFIRDDTPREPDDVNDTCISNVTDDLGDDSAWDGYLFVGYEATHHTCRTLINYSLPTLPSSAIVISADLTLQWKDGYTTTSTLDLYRLTKHFDSHRANWTVADIEDWTNPGGDYAGVIIDSITKGFDSGDDRYNLSWDVTNTVLGWLNSSYENYGFLLKARDENTTNVQIFESESNHYGGRSGIDQWGPRLNINWTMPELQPMSIKITPNNPMANSTIDINVTIENRGGVDSSAFNVSYYIDDNFIQKNTLSGGLLGNRSLTYDNITYDASGKWGNHTFKVSIDIDNTTWESDETNNNITETIFLIFDYNPLDGYSQGYADGYNQGYNEGVANATSANVTTNITADKWTWLGYLNESSKISSILYSEIINCTYLVMQNTTTGYYYTYGPGIEESFTITFGSAVCILLLTDESWDHK